MLGVTNTSFTMVVAKLWDWSGVKSPLVFLIIEHRYFGTCCTCVGTPTRTLCAGCVLRHSGFRLSLMGVRIPSSMLLADGSSSNMEPFDLSVGIWGQVVPTLVDAPPNFQHRQPQHSPYPVEPKKFGTVIQDPIPTDKSPTLGEKEQRRIQQIMGTILYCTRAMDMTILVVLSSNTSKQRQRRGQWQS